MNKKAFSLVEIIIAVTIIILLAIVGASVSNSMRIKSNNGKVTADVATLKTSVESYKTDESTLLEPKGNLNYFTKSGTYTHDESEAYGVYGKFTEDSLAKKYLNIIPLDPKTNQYYSYGVKLNNSQFEIAGILEENDTFSAKVVGDYDGKGGIFSLIREYNGPNFIRDSYGYLPYNPEQRIFIAKGSDGKIYKEGETITVGSEDLELYFSDGSVSLVTAGSMLKLEKMHFPKENNLIATIKIYLDAGSIWTQAAKIDLKEGSSFEVQTGDFTASVRGTIFEVKPSQVVVYKGKVEVTTNVGISQIVNDGEIYLNGRVSAAGNIVLPNYQTPDYIATPINEELELELNSAESLGDNGDCYLEGIKIKNGDSHPAYKIKEKEGENCADDNITKTCVNGIMEYDGNVSNPDDYMFASCKSFEFKNENCDGSLPDNPESFRKTISTYKIQEDNEGNTEILSNNTQWKHDPNLSVECSFACNSGYIFENNQCILNTTSVECGLPPQNAVWTATGDNKQTITYLVNETIDTTTKYSTEKDEKECRWMCDSNSQYINGVCKSYTYDWDYTSYGACSAKTVTLGEWGECNKTCGTGEQTRTCTEGVGKKERTATCKRNDGTTVDKEYCGTPTLRESCNTNLCASQVLTQPCNNQACENIETCTGTKPSTNISTPNGTTYELKWNAVNNQYVATGETTWQSIKPTGSCYFKCNDGYKLSGTSCTAKTKSVNSAIHNNRTFAFTEFTLTYGTPQTKSSSNLNITNGISVLKATFTLGTDGTTVTLSSLSEKITCNIGYKMSGTNCVAKTKTVNSAIHNNRTFAFTAFTLAYNSSQTKTSSSTNITNGKSILTATFKLGDDGNTVNLSDEKETFTCIAGYYLVGTDCKPVGKGYFSAANDIKRIECQNKPQNSQYTGTTNSSANCTWSCNNGYVGEKCVLGTKNYTCKGLPANAVWSSNSLTTKTIAQSTENGITRSPTDNSLASSHNTSTLSNACYYKCDTGFTRNPTDKNCYGTCGTYTSGNGTFTTGKPTSLNTAWQTTNKDKPCYVRCNANFTWNTINKKCECTTYSEELESELYPGWIETIEYKCQSGGKHDNGTVTQAKYNLNNLKINNLTYNSSINNIKVTLFMNDDTSYTIYKRVNNISKQIYFNYRPKDEKYLTITPKGTDNANVSFE